MKSQGWMRIARVATAMAAVGVLAATALAVPTPKSASFIGKTGQVKNKKRDRAVWLDTNAKRHVSRFAILWKARCKRSDASLKEGTEWGPEAVALPQSGNTFGHSGSYSARLHGTSRRYRGVYRASVKGHFTDKNHAQGRFKISVKVKDREGERPDDTCAASMAWKVHRK
jgi:hypothetical protein